MAQHIGQAFLDQTIYGDVDCFAHAIDGALEPKLAFDLRMPAAPNANQILHRFAQAQMIERAGPQLADDPVHHVVDMARDIDDGLRTRVDFAGALLGTIRDGCADRLDRGDTLAKLVVKLARDGSTLFFEPRLNELCQTP